MISDAFGDCKKGRLELLPKGTTEKSRWKTGVFHNLDPIQQPTSVQNIATIKY